MTRVAASMWREGGKRRPSVRPLGRDEDGDRFSSSIAEAVQRALADRTRAPVREGVLTLVLGERTDGASETEPTSGDAGARTGLVTMVPATFADESLASTPSAPSLAPPHGEESGDAGLADKAIALAGTPPSLLPAPELPARSSSPGDRATPEPRLSREEASGARALFRALARPLADAAASLDAMAMSVVDVAATPPAPDAPALPEAFTTSGQARIARASDDVRLAHDPHAVIDVRAPYDAIAAHDTHAAIDTHAAHDTHAVIDDERAPAARRASRATLHRERAESSRPSAAAEPSTREPAAWHLDEPRSPDAPLPGREALVPSPAPAAALVSIDARPMASVPAAREERSLFEPPPLDERAAPLERVHYAALDTDHAKVELSHPTLGHLELEVRGEGTGVDVTMLTRSLGASIALRAAEASLRSDLGRRSTELRSYRVRTDASAHGSESPEDDEETT